MAEQGGVGGQRDDVQERRGVAQQSVRGDHERVERRVAARGEQAAAQDDRPRVAHHAPLACELALHGGHHLLGRARRGGVDRAPAALDHVEGQREVVAHDRIDAQVGLGAHRVDGAVARGDRRQLGLARADGHLVAPVQALLVGAAVVDEAHLAAGVADAGVREGRRQRAQRAGLPERVGVGEGQQLAAGALDGGVLRAHLPAPRQLEHDVGARRPRPGRRVVGRAVARDDDLQALGAASPARARWRPWPR